MSPVDVFRAVFWRNTVNLMLSTAGGSALNALTLSGIGQAVPTTNIQMPGWGVLVAFGVGLLLGLFYSLVGQAIPGTGIASVLPPVPEVKKTAKRAPRKRAPKKAPTTADLKQPDAAHGGE